MANSGSRRKLAATVETLKSCRDIIARLVTRRGGRDDARALRSEGRAGHADCAKPGLANAANIAA